MDGEHIVALLIMQLPEERNPVEPCVLGFPPVSNSECGVWPASMTVPGKATAAGNGITSENRLIHRTLWAESVRQRGFR